MKLQFVKFVKYVDACYINPLNTELNPTWQLYK